MRRSFCLPSLAYPEKARSRPRHAGNPPGDPGQRGITLASILEPVVENADRVHLLMPFANQLGARPQRDDRRCPCPAALVGALAKRTQPPLGAEAQAAVTDALRVWPNPLLEEWAVTTITLVARYFNAKPDEITIACRSLSLFDAEIETEYDASGLPQYQRVVGAAFVLAKGIDATIIRKLTWDPQQLVFTDSTTGLEKTIFVRAIDALSRSNSVKFFLDSPVVLLSA
jgi:hypothetical protein